MARASARDLAELASGKASARDRREAGGGGRKKPKRLRSKFARAVKRGRGGPTKVRRKRRKR